MHSALFAPAVFKNKPGLETQLLLDFFQGKPSTFVDVGGNFPETSVSTPLEKAGWMGVVIEPQSDCFKALQMQRTSHVMQCACISEQAAQGGMTHIRLYLAGPKSSTDLDFIALRERTESFIDVPAKTLHQILSELKINVIGLLSLDTEGTEIDVMNGLDWSRYQPELILIEDHARNFSKHRYLTAKGYRLFRRTGFNSWYAKPERAHPISLFGWLQMFRKYILSMPFRNLRRWRHNRSA